MPTRITTTITALERVFGPFGAEHGISPSTLDAVERRLGTPLPAALRALYQRTGRHPFHTAENRLVAPDGLAFDRDHLVFYEENQGVCVWAIASAALGDDDPAVDSSVMTEHGLDYLPSFSSVSDFLAFQAAQQAVATLPWSGLILEPYEVAGIGKIEPRRRITREHAALIGEVLASNAENDIRFRTGAIAMISSITYFSLAAGDESVFREIVDALGVGDDDWDFFAPRDA